MFALRSIAQTFTDRGTSLRNIGGSETADEEDGENPDAVAVTASKVSAVAKVRGEERDLLKNDDSLLLVLEDLKREERRDPGSNVTANVELEASIGLTGSNASSVSSAVKMTAFLFEQLLGDLDALAHKGAAPKRGDRKDLVEEFHAHMTEAIQALTETHATNLGREFGSAEAVLSQGAEEYIASIRKLVKKDVEDTVTVWYRGLKYDAFVPTSQGAQEHMTVGSACYALTVNPIVRALGALRDLVAPSDSGDYERLGAGDAEAPVGRRVKPVLKDLTGILKPGRLTLVLGPPGCGKTSFLKAISGSLHKQRGVQARVAGEVRYNWFLVEQLKRLSNWSTYVSQVDEHLPMLTVRETLEFAWKCRKMERVNNPQVYEAMVDRVGKEAADRIVALNEVEVDFVLATLGLSACADTIIGNATLKGVSGGEKRRVTLGEMLVTGANVVCLDEISTGLDSAATFDICRYLSACAHFLGQMVAVALLQPPPEVIELFDDIVLLAEGNVIYHGPRESITDYFERLGYRCPPRKDLGDFLQELPTSSGADFLMSEAEREKAMAPKRPPRTADEFGLAWKQSDEGRRMSEEVVAEAQRQFEIEERMATDPNPLHKLTWDNMPVNATWTELRVVLAWSWNLKMSNKAEIIARVFQNVFMGLIFGSLFWQIGEDEWYLKAMLFSQMPSFMQAGGIGSVPRLVQERKIMYKHTAAKFYQPWSFVLSQFLVQLPFTVFDAMVFGNLLYWMCGLVPNTGRYLMFVLLAILFGLCVNQMMRIFAYSVRNESAALVCAVLSYLLFIIFSGQLATPGVIPGYLKWLFWINPLAWVYRAMAINEFKDPDHYGEPGSFCSVKDASGHKQTVPFRCGDFYLRNRQFETDEAYVMYAVYVLLAYTVVFLLVTVLVVARVRFDRDYTDSEAEAAAEQTADADASQGASDASAVVDMAGERAARGGFARTESLAVSLKTLVFSDLWYTIKLPGAGSEADSNTVDLLKGVSGWAVPGRMTALMGSSGAGKTTLLDVLADRKTTGAVTGHILVNSAPPDPATFRKIVGYVEQFGVHANQATVLESLLFSASLRLPPRAQHKVNDFVRETMALLELDTIAEELTKSLSVEENKRLTIAVELVANPSILFADEPTSGLDARAAAIVMRSIQNVARSGRTVICTIHQPSIAVFSMFDDLLLMRRGGSVVFFGELGENSQNLIKYFEAIPGTQPCPVGYNPATWMLEVIGAGTSSAKAGDAVDYAAVYRKSKLCQLNRDRLRNEFLAPESRDTPLAAASYLGSAQALGRGSGSQHNLFSPLLGSGQGQEQGLVALASAGGELGLQSLETPVRRRILHQQSKRLRSEAPGKAAAATAPFSKQLWMLLDRSRRTYWRSPEFSLSRLLVIMLVGIIITLTFWQQEYSTAADTQSRVSSVSFMVFLAGAYNLYTIMPFTIEKRALFYRETSSGMYSALAAVASDGLVEIPYLLAETFIGVNIVYWGVGFNDAFGAYMYYSVMFFLYLTLMSFLGAFFAALMPDQLSAQLIASVLVQIFQLFAGVIVPYTKLPVYYKWLFYFSPQQWCQAGLITTQFHMDETRICDPFGKIVEHAPGHMAGKVCSADGRFTLGPDGNPLLTGVVKTAEEYVFNAKGAFLDGYKFEDRFYDVLVVSAWIVGIRIATSLTVLFVDHNKR